MNVYLISQTFALAAFFLALICYQYPRRTMLLLCATAGVCNACHFFILARPTAGMLALLIAVRILVFVYSTRKELFYLFFVMTLLIGVGTYKDAYSLLPILATLLGTYATFQRDELLMRKGMFVCSSLWTVNNVCIGSWVAVCMEGSSILSNVLSMARLRHRRISLLPSSDQAA